MYFFSLDYENKVVFKDVHVKEYLDFILIQHQWSRGDLV